MMGPLHPQGENVESVFISHYPEGATRCPVSRDVWLSEHASCCHHRRRLYIEIYTVVATNVWFSWGEKKKNWHSVEHNTSAFNLWKYKMKSCTIYVQAYLYKTINSIYYWVLWHSQKYHLSTVIVSTSQCAKRKMHKIIQTRLQCRMSLNPTVTGKQEHTRKRKEIVYIKLYRFLWVHKNDLISASAIDERSFKIVLRLITYSSPPFFF